MNRVTTSDNQLLDEEAVIAKAKENPANFKDLYDRYYPVIYRFLLKRLGDRDLTGDIAAQVFLKALTNLGQFSFRGLPFSSWLFRIAANECNSYFRKSNRVRMIVIDESISDSIYEEMFDSQFKEEMVAKLTVLLQKLKADELTLIELRYFEGRSFQEVAEITGITENNAKVKTYRTLDKLRKMALAVFQ